MKSTETTYFVRPEGETEEEPFSWDAIEKMCRSGQFTSETRIFFPDKNAWVRVGDTDLKSILKDRVGRAPAKKEEPEDPEREALAEEYREALRQVNEQPEAFEAHVEAGRVAADMSDRDAARKHFQNALELKPFNSRVAQEVQSRFSKSECRQFRFLRRDPPAWDEPYDIISFPLARGISYIAVPAAALFVLLLVPFGLYLAWPLAFLWCLQTARQTAAGSQRPPLWNAALANPAREIILPVLAGSAVLAECTLVAYGVGRLTMVLSQGEGSAFRYVAGSPVVSVTLTVIALAYLPAVFVRITHSAGIIVDLLNPWVIVKAMLRMEQEYATAALLVLVLAFLIGGLSFLVGGIPVVGDAVLAAAAAFAIPMTGFILGRLAGRMEHVL